LHALRRAVGRGGGGVSTRAQKEADFAAVRREASFEAALP
jgi:hypothetical protein